MFRARPYRERPLTARLLLGIATAASIAVLGAADSARAIDPDDTPWTVNDADPGKQPASIEDLLARDRQTIIEDHDIAPPGQDQPDYVGAARDGQFDDDRLTPKLPAEIHDAPARQPDTAIRTIDPAAEPARRFEPAQASPQAAQPQFARPAPAAAPEPLPPASEQRALVAPAAAAPAAVKPAEAQHHPAAAAAAPANPPQAQPSAAHQKAAQPKPVPAANGQPAAGQPIVQAAPATPGAGAPRTVAPGTGASGAITPAGAPSATGAPANRPLDAMRAIEPIPQMPTPPALATPPPAEATVAVDAHDPSAPPPLAVPSAPVEQATVAVNGKLYLPLKRYFETKAAVTLADADLEDRAALADFYTKTVGEALWVTKDGFNAAAQSLMEEIRKADDWGLASVDYKLPGLTRVGAGEFDYEDLADAEVKLSMAAMEYARHARGDRIYNPTEQLSSYIDRKPQLVPRPQLIDALAQASDKGAYLRSLHPKHAQFEMLREKLVELRTAQKTGTEPEPIPDGPKITPGKVHWQIALLRKRLKTELPQAKPDGTPMEEGYYDENLARAVIAYKQKNGLEPVNATVSGDLRKSLNQKTNIDEEALLANMEQWRWMPETLGDTYVWVNIPEFLVRVKKQDQIIHEERIVTGRYETQTPVFSHRMRTVVFQPSWNVPESIKVNELLPKLRAGDNPIESQGLRMERNGRMVDAWDVDWSRQDIRNYHIFQPPGDSNVLGVVKFLFPNKHSVYLHDTPTKRLFNEKVRTFSHGCMRVRNPVRLAEVIMAEDKGWDKERVNELITSGPEDNDVTLDKPMPVHVTYFTLWVNDGGDVQRFADVYGHEKRIKLGLHGRWEEIEKNRDHLAPADPAAVVSREDWGDQDDDDRPSRSVRRSRPRYSYQDEPRQIYRAPNGPGYRQVSPKKRPTSSFSDFMSNIFGAN